MNQTKEYRIFAYTTNVKDCSDMKTLQMYDRSAACAIERLEEALEAMKAHRQKIYEQAQRVAAAAVTVNIER